MSWSKTVFPLITAAVKKAKKAGAKSIHFDMSFTADGVAVALRPTNLQDIQKDALKNKTSEMTLDIAQNLDVASLHPLKAQWSILTKFYLILFKTYIAKGYDRMHVGFCPLDQEATVSLVSKAFN